MEIERLLRYLLFEEIFIYFDLVDVIEIQDHHQLEFHLEEKVIKPSSGSNEELVSNGFDEPVRIQDFPLRDKTVYFIVRRRKWKGKHSGKIYSTRWDLTANGTSYTKEFAAFLKELFGQLPDKLE